MIILSGKVVVVRPMADWKVSGGHRASHNTPGPGAGELVSQDCTDQPPPPAAGSGVRGQKSFGKFNIQERIFRHVVFLITSFFHFQKRRDKPSSSRQCSHAPNQIMFFLKMMTPQT